MSCSKLPYRTQWMALRAMRAIGRKSSRPGAVVPIGAHFCSECRCWHLTVEVEDSDAPVGEAPTHALTRRIDAPPHHRVRPSCVVSGLVSDDVATTQPINEGLAHLAPVELLLVLTSRFHDLGFRDEAVPLAKVGALLLGSV